MKKLILFLMLTASCFWEVQAQTACANWASVSTISQVNSFYGLQDVHHFDCFSDIILDGSCTTGATDYRLRIAEFDLNTWSFTKDYVDDWVANTPPPANINVSSYFPANEPTCGKIYWANIAVGPVWDATPPLFFTVNCTDIPLNETYACKEDIVYSDFDTKDKAHDQLLLDDGTRVHESAITEMFILQELTKLHSLLYSITDHWSMIFRELHSPMNLP